MAVTLNSKYSLLDLVRLSWSLFTTYLFFRPARLIRQPTRIRGFKYMKIERGFTTGAYCRIEAAEPHDLDTYSLAFGRNVQINDSCHIAAMEKIIIGNNVLIASKVFITDHDHGGFDEVSLKTIPKERPLVISPVIIGDNVWLGEGVIVLKGVNIGEGSVVGAGAVVTSDIPSYSLALGVPARVVKSFKNLTGE